MNSHRRHHALAVADDALELATVVLGGPFIKPLRGVLDKLVFETQKSLPLALGETKNNARGLGGWCRR